NEVVQLYVRDVESSVRQPLKQLKGFRRINLKKGETRTVTIPVTVKNLSYWDEGKKQSVVEPGKFEILVGSSSSDIRLKAMLEVSKQ
ncbi:MAG: fibronectin type III-like domain-contianing protein, partial [bacterium]